MELCNSFEVRRGIVPAILLQHVRNTAAFIFEEDFVSRFPPDESRYEHLAIIQRATTQRPLSHLEYFELCLAAHHVSVGTYVPTDVDSQIRFKLWHPALPTGTLVAMAQTVLRSRAWDCRPMSTRWIASLKDPQLLISGHDGEWLSTAAGAYAALRKRAPEQAAEIAGAIVRELQKEAQLYRERCEAREGIGMLKIATLIAHNLGDLDRVLDLWNVGDEDPLKSAVYKAGHVAESPAGSREPGTETRFDGVLWAAGKLNKDCMAIENHRHFALRAARPLRKSSDLLLPIGPFFDDWGALVAAHPGLTPEEKGLVAERLIDGWERLAGPIGYARALAGMLENFPGGFQSLSQYLPAKLSRTLKSGPLRSLCAVPKKRFEEQWAQTALKTALKTPFRHASS